MNLRRILSQAALIIGTLIFAIGLQAYAQTFTQPSAGPTNGNAVAPLDTGSSLNIKAGSLVVNDSTNPAPNGFLVASGNVGIGTTNPIGNLDIENGSNSAKLCLNNNCINAWPSSTAPGTVIYSCGIYNGNGGYSYLCDDSCIGLSTQSTCITGSYKSGLNPGSPSGCTYQTHQCSYIGHLEP